MPNYTVSVAAATAIVGADLLTGEVFARAPQNRVLMGIAMTGSAAEGDSAADVYIDEVRVSALYNGNLLFPDNDDLLPLEALGVPAGAQLRVIVTDAAATNPLACMVALRDV